MEGNQVSKSYSKGVIPLKKLITIILSVCMLLTICPGVYANTDKLYLYVQNGAENGNGTIDAPFGKWEQARDYIRQIKKEGKYPSDGVVVYFREGYLPSLMNL